MARWYTCAPLRFEANASFFWRDSGLLCRGLQALGYESRVVLPGPPFESDTPDVIRGTLQELESAAWWRRLKLDGVIMVAWGCHRDTPIVRAIAESGARVILHIDGNCTHFPLYHRRETLKMLWRSQHDVPYGLIRKCGSIFGWVAKESGFILLKHSFLKVRHLSYLTLLSCQTPTSVEGNLRLCRLFGGKHHGIKVRLLGYPISGACEWDGSVKKEKRIIAIGRWDDLRVKRPYVLMAVCEAIARKHADLKVDIFGTKIDAFDTWLCSLEPGLRERITVHGFQPGEKVAEVLLRSQVSFFPSASEGGPQALFEGLSGGTTTVALDSPYLPGSRWAAEVGHLAKWERGEYSPGEISKFWVPRTRVDLVLQSMLALASEGNGNESESGPEGCLDSTSVRRG
jgi:glycosyltransferase involved in cell wall biosynthesis